MLVAGGVPATMPICLPFRRASAQRRDLVKTAALPDNQRVSGPVVGIGALHQIIALRIAHDDVATMRGKRHPDKTDRLRIVRIVQLFLQLLRKQLAELVFEFPRPCRSRTANCADRRTPAAPWDRRARSTGRWHHWSARWRYPCRRISLASREARPASGNIVPYLSSCVSLLIGLRLLAINCSACHGMQQEYPRAGFACAATQTSLTENTRPIEIAP